jgi:GNAT superfamily N-acetyltransferase
LEISYEVSPIDDAQSLSLILRSVQPDDEPFLLDVYADHRKEELDQASWNAEQRQSFISQQFHAQLQHYRSHYPQGSHDIILFDTAPIGRIYIDRGDEEIRLLDISLLSKYRNKGFGAVLMRNLLDEADRLGKPVRLYVYKMNQAVRFYERLGFQCVEDTGVHYFMERLAG